MGQQRSPVPYRLEREASYILIITHRTGLLSFLGHEHAILSTDWTADLHLDPQEIARTRANIVIPTRALVIDATEVRALAGLGTGPSAGDVADIQLKMLDSAHLDADGHPEIRLELLTVEEPRPGVLDVRGRMTIRGVAKPVRFPAGLERLNGGAIRVTGGFSIRQSAFGIRPEAVAGVVRVADEVDIRFVLHAKPENAP